MSDLDAITLAQVPRIQRAARDAQTRVDELERMLMALGWPHHAMSLDHPDLPDDLAEPIKWVQELHAERDHLEDALHDRKTWTFDTLMYVADRLLSEFYPDDIFPDVPDEDAKGDPGPQLIRAIRRCRRALAGEQVAAPPYMGGFYQSIGGEPAPTRGLPEHGPGLPRRRR